MGSTAVLLVFPTSAVSILRSDGSNFQLSRKAVHLRKKHCSPRNTENISNSLNLRYAWPETHTRHFSKPLTSDSDPTSLACVKYLSVHYLASNVLT